MQTTSKNLGVYNTVTEVSGSYVFTGCNTIEPRSIYIGVALKDDVQIQFQDSNGEVHIPCIEIYGDGQLKAILHNQWSNSKGQKGYFSLLHHVEQLKICDSSQTLRDFVNYIKGAYTPGAHWSAQELNKTMKIQVARVCQDDFPLLKEIRSYFENVEVTVQQKVTIDNTINEDCTTCFFMDCKETNLESLTIDAVVKEIYFCGTYDEISIEKIVIDKRGKFRGIICNRWESDAGAKQIGYYSLLPYVKILTIRDNPGAVQDLLNYVKGGYIISDKRWDSCVLSRDIQIDVEGSDVPLVMALKLTSYFNSVMVNGKSTNGPLIKYFKRYSGLQLGQLEYFTEFKDHVRLGKDGPTYHVLGCTGKRIMCTYVQQKLEKNQFICFHETDVPLESKEIYFEKGGELRNVLQNFWFNGKKGGFFSLLNEAEQLYIDDPSVIQDLIDCAENKYEINSRWQVKELNKDVKIWILHIGENQHLVKKLQSYFTQVMVKNVEVDLKVDNVIDVDCGTCTFTNCKVAQQHGVQSLTINAQIDSENIKFQDTKGAIIIPHIIFGKSGCLRPILQSSWNSNSTKGGQMEGYTNLLYRAEQLTINGNKQVIMELVDYLERDKRVNPYRHRYKGPEKPSISKNTKISITDLDPSSQDYVGKLRQHFTEVVIDQIRGFLMKSNTVSQECKGCTFVNCRAAEPQYLIIDADIGNKGVIFHNADEEVHIQDITIGKRGRLDHIIYNQWDNCEEGANHSCGLFSLLPHAKVLTIKNNPRALKDLADYTKGTYAVGNSQWTISALNKNMMLVVECTEGELHLVRRLKAHFTKVVLKNAKLPLETNNVIDLDCDTLTFINCRNAQPQSLVINAQIWSKTSLAPATNEDILRQLSCGFIDAKPWITFRNANERVCIPDITIGPRGSLNSVVNSKWCGSGDTEDATGERFSLLAAARSLTIVANRKALNELLDYVQGRVSGPIQYFGYDSNDHRRARTQVNQDMAVRVRDLPGVSEQDALVLAEYFGAVAVNGTKRLSKRRRALLDASNERGQPLRRLRAEVLAKRRRLRELAAAMAVTAGAAAAARERLRRRREQWDACTALAE